MLVVGDFMTDRYFVGTSTRVSPEAPVPIVKVERTFDLPGGSGNVAANLRSLGMKIFEVTGDEVQDRYIVKNRLMVGDHQLARWDQDYQYTPVRFNLDDLNNRRAIVIADYLKGSIDQTVIEELASLNLPTFVDTKGNPSPYLLHFRDVTIFPNLKEYSSFKDTYNEFRSCVLKKSEAGLSLLRYGVEIASLPARARWVRSVNGAGDTVVAAFTHARLSGMTEFGALLRASLAAASVVEQPYTSTPDPDFIHVAA